MTKLNDVGGLAKIFLLISIFLLQSCTSDDSLEDSILGKWELYKTSVNGYETSPNCQELNQLNFSKNKTVYVTEFVSINGVCEENEVIESNWLDHGDSYYSLGFVDASGQSVFVNFDTIDYFSYAVNVVNDEGEFTYTYYYRRN
ncbi:hypothetical protein [Aureivirga sp. CE67]|uniref:hypothetical protein n=1 Tax=Aureivirga sp. CE67 TaxID=1788983 RepID=UPI0018C94CA7|nr:hypothetical protein [Aureivirga sp. CE67]